MPLAVSWVPSTVGRMEGEHKKGEQLWGAGRGTEKALRPQKYEK